MDMKYGARNQLTGKVVAVKKGDVMCQVRLEVDPGAVMNSVMTMESLADLGIKEGDSVKIVVKAINVLLVRE
jgi:molybdopterin-binding protein